MAERIILTADEGYVYTDGKDIYGEMIWLEVGKNADNFYQVTREEYNEIRNTPKEKATEEDYQNALKEMGVEV